MADSDDVQLLHPPGRTPTYLFPREHVRTGLFESSARRQSDPGMGERTYWDLRAGDRRAEDAAYSWERPPEAAAAIAGLVAFDWDSLRVFEEDEEVFVHPRDPLHPHRRAAQLPARAAGERATGALVPPARGRPHRPAGAERHDDAVPLQGDRHYWSLRLPGRSEEDLVWSYPEPFHDVEAVRGLLCFPQDRVELEVSAS